MQVIDDWFTARKLGLVFEAKVGNGNLLVCSIDLKNDLDDNPVARQMLHSLLAYMAGDRFKPAVQITPQQVRSLFAQPSPIQTEVKSIKADSFEPNFEPANAIDGNPDTMWHTAWTPTPTAFPHELRIELKRPLVLRGFTALPRQDRNRNGMIKEYECYVSADDKDWGQPVAKGAFSADESLKTVNFAAPQAARFIRLVALSGYANGPWASLAEFDLITDSPPQPR